MSEVYLPAVVTNDGPTLAVVCHAYQTDRYSPYWKGRYCTRQNADALIRRLVTEYGHWPIAKIGPYEVSDWYTAWLGPDGKKVAMGHSLVGMLRTVVGFGATYRRSPECRELKQILSGMRFAMSKPNPHSLSVEQAIAIRKKAHEMGLHSIALAQGLGWNGGLRQRDVIGEYVPTTENVTPLWSDGERFWLRGAHWSEIDENLIWRHIISKKQKPIEMDLKLAPMFMAELQHLGPVESLTGPVIMSEETGCPFSAVQYRRLWRKIADACGVPKHIKSMHTRPGRITTALQYGAPLQAMRKMATHSDEKMTQRYSRRDAEDTAKVMALCAEQEAAMEAAA